MKKKKKSAGKARQPGKKMLRKAELAMENRFFLEASWIFSAMIEKRLKKMILRVEKSAPGAGFTLEQSVKRVKFMHQSGKYPRFSAQCDLRLIEGIRSWKNQRNAILKDLQDVHVSEGRMERLAREGRRLVKEWNEFSGDFLSLDTAD
jgi:hypothetical protein